MVGKEPAQHTQRMMLGKEMRTTQACRREIAVSTGLGATSGPIGGRHGRTSERKPEQKDWLRPLQLRRAVSHPKIC